jgi:hypothetical protein
VITLAEVLAALEAVKRAPPGQVIERLSFADVAGEYILANRAELERIELERAAMAHRDGSGATLGEMMIGRVVVTDGNRAPRLSCPVFQMPELNIYVGADWRPDEKP